MASTGTTTYEELREKHRWEVPERYNIARDVCFKHPADKLAMIHEDPAGTVREVRWGELQELTNRFANVLAARGVTKGDRIAMLLPPTPETAAAFLATWHSGAILLSMSTLYGDEGIRHRVRDSQAKLVAVGNFNFAVFQQLLCFDNQLCIDRFQIVIAHLAASDGLGRIITHLAPGDSLEGIVAGRAGRDRTQVLV